MKPRIFGIESEYGVVFSPVGQVYLPLEKILGYIFEGLVPNNLPSNTFLENGARFYQDTGCHPEYATPECDTIRDLITYDKAGERLLEMCLPAVENRLREEGMSGVISVFKNNTDSLGNTYGCHENFLMSRNVDFWNVTEQLVPFFVTRQVYAGAGKMMRVNGRPHFFVSQRAQHIHEETSSSTTSSRSIINTRDEPHADAEQYRRLHIIVGDSNMSEFATYLKVGTTAIVLSMIEDGFHIRELQLEDPVRAIREISRDPTLKQKVKLENGQALSAIEIQRSYFQRAQDYLCTRRGDGVANDVLQNWASVLDRLDDDPMSLTRELDWVSKRHLMSSYVEGKRCDWDDPKIAMIDLQYHNVQRSKGIYYLLERHNRMDRVVDDQAIDDAMSIPPQSTRAKVRGDFIRFARAKNQSYTIDWTYLKLNGYWEETILCMDPFQSTNLRVDELLEQLPASARWS